MAFSPDGGTLLTGAGDGSIWEWNVTNGLPLRRYLGHRNEINALAFAPDGQSFVSASSDNYARVWSPASGTLVQSFRVPGWVMLTAAFSPDGTHVVTADTSFTNIVTLWSVGTGERTRTFGEHVDEVRALAFLPNGQLVTGGADQRVRVWNVETGERTGTLERAIGGIACFVPDPTGSRLQTS